MAHTYLLFDFGSDEEKAQQARHKLEGWKQAFRLDKKLLYKLDRDEAGAAETTTAAEPKGDVPAAAGPKSAKGSSKSSKAGKSGSKTDAKAKSKAAGEKEAAPAPGANGKVNLLVRLYFSGHEKLTEQRWLERIPGEEPFKDASPRVVRQGQPEFEELVQQFESLE